MYEYKELIEKVKENPSQENLTALADWFSHYDEQDWNGECYNTEKELGGNLFPVYEEKGEDEFEIVGWEIR